jgi:CheY-like chemotaxis protein
MTAHMRKEGNETLRVAVVDDDSFYREYVARLLDVAGLRAFQAGNGATSTVSVGEIDWFSNDAVAQCKSPRRSFKRTLLSVTATTSGLDAFGFSSWI